MKNEDKRMYVVKGTEDGNIGVFTNIKLAYACAFDYVKDDIGTDEKLISYSTITKAFKEGYFCRSIRDAYGSEVNAEIQNFNLNYKYWEV